MLSLGQLHEGAIREQQLDAQRSTGDEGGLRQGGAVRTHRKRARDGDVPVDERVADGGVVRVQVVRELEEGHACFDDDAARAGCFSE